MPASFVHQYIAEKACIHFPFFADSRLRSAALAGSEGPDPLFFMLYSVHALRLGMGMHMRKTDDFLLALADASRSSTLASAYCLGFFTHYAADTIIHPFIYAHSLSRSGRYAYNAHYQLEHDLETIHYRRHISRTGLPVQLAGIAALSPGDRDAISRVMARTIATVYPEMHPSQRLLRQSFDTSVQLSRFLRSENARRRRLLSVLHPMRIDRFLLSHTMPSEPPAHDAANQAHRVWFSPWEPAIPRSESFEDLCLASIDRARSLVEAADGYMRGQVSADTLRALHGGLSYSSGLPWRASCSAARAAGARRA